MRYRLTKTNYIQLLTDDGLTHVGHIHAEPEGNNEYAEYLEWLEADNTPDPYIDPVPTYKELRAAEYNLKTMGEQFGMQYDDAKNSTTTWVDWQTEIKERITE